MSRLRLALFGFVLSGLISLPASRNCAAQGKIDWKKDYETALAQARKQGKLLVAHFWLEDRPLSKAMDEETFSQPEVIKLSNERFLNVKISIAARPDLFDNTIGGRGGLGTCVLDSRADVVATLPGYADSATYLEFLRKAERGHPKLKAAREGVVRKPGDPAALYSLAETYQSLGSPRKAEENYEKLIRLGSGKRSNREVTKYVAFSHERIARFRALRGKNLEAAQHVAEYRRLDPDNRFGKLDRILLTEALVSWIDRRFKDAIRILEQTLREFPASDERDQMLLALAVVRHEGGDDQRALAILEKLIKEHPLSSSLPRAREQMAHIKNPPAEHVH